MALISRRVGLLFAAFLILFAIAIGRAAWIQAVQGSGLSADAQSQQTRSVTVFGERGRILDRNGKELAVSEDAADVIATPYQVTDPAGVAAKLGPVLEVPQSEIVQALADRSSGFAYLARKVDLPAAERVRQLDLDGVDIVPDSRRVYPEGKLASQVIGAVGLDNQGLTGLEAYEDDLLQGDNGERQILLDGLGDEIGRETVDSAERGGDLRLTLDAGLQAETERVIGDLGETYDPAGATAIVMDPRSSEVLAMASWPPFDPEDPGEADPDALQNLATGFTYEPGSTFKAFTIGGALEAGLVTPETTFGLAPTIQVADRTIEEAHERGPVTLSVAQILAQSSNVGAVTVGLELGGERFDEWIRRFGFGAPTGIEFPGEEQGIVPDYPDEYSGSTMGNLPIGQGLSVTPMQMAAGYAAIANGGVLREPRLVLDEAGETVDADTGKRIISRSTSAKLRKMLEGVLAPGGTASEVSVPGYTLAGKTGTAQVAIEGGYSETEFVASFVGFAPAEDPQLLVTVVVDRPQGSYYGGVVAAPAFGEIAKFALPYLGIAPDGAGQTEP
jgi:cell division protein FtsI/penicillin-binding protein 2